MSTTKSVYWVCHEVSSNEPRTVVSIWDTEEAAKQEAQRLNDLEKQNMHQLWNYEVDEIELNVPSSNGLN